MTIESSPRWRWSYALCLAVTASSCQPRPAPVELPHVPGTPRLPDVTSLDRDTDRLDDRLITTGSAVVPVHVVLTRPVTPAQLEAFTAAGGTVGYVFKAISYGFLGKLPRDRVAGLPAALGESLHVVTLPPTATQLGDVETRNGRARAAWPTTTGSANTTIAIFDSGLDLTHPDLAGRKIFWKDYSSDAHPEPVDRDGHGTHVAGIALGSGAAMTNTLRYTTAGLLHTVSQGSIYGTLLLAPGPLTVSASARVTSTSPASLRLNVGDPSNNWQTLGSTTGVTPLSVTGQPVAEGSRFQVTLQPSVWPGGQFFAITHALSGYPTFDAYPVMSGVAPGARWYAGKIFADDGSGDDGCPLIAFDELLQQHQSLRVKVVNLSIGSYNPAMSAAAATMVDNGLVVVISAGNLGPSGTAHTLGLTARAITVGATASNQVTSYSSMGTETPTADQDLKPDLVAPGGSINAPFFSADPNGTDARTFPDAQPDDYHAMQGTSMAAPFVSGAAALIIDAMEQHGHVWNFSSPGGPLRVKMLLLATASETNAEREGATDSPTLGRAAQPKDKVEGYGLINTDAAIEAVSQVFVSPLTDTATVSARPQGDKRVWARQVPIHAGASAQFTLSVPATGDFDLYVYAADGDSKGNPIILASSTNPAPSATETLTFTSAVTQTALVVVKRVSGSGTFNLSGTIGNSPADPPGAVFLTSAALSSDSGNPSASVWGEYVTFNYVAVGNAAKGAPTGVIEFKTSGMLGRGAAATGGIIGSGQLVANGPGCQAQTLPCASAQFTTPNLVVSSIHANNHRIFASYGGDADYAQEPVINLNGSNARNHTVTPRLLTDVNFDWQMASAIRLPNIPVPLVVSLTLGCPSGRTCITPPPPPISGVNGIDRWAAAPSPIRVTCDNPFSAPFQRPDDFQPITTARLVDSNWQVKCQFTMTNKGLGTTGLTVRFIDYDPYFANAPGFPVSVKTTSVYSWEPVHIQRIAGANPSALGAPVSFRFSGSSAGHIEVVDGPCEATPPAPVLAAYDLTVPSGATKTLTISNLPSGVHDLHVCNIGGFPPRLLEAGIVLQAPAAPSDSLSHTVLGSMPPAATTTTLNVTPTRGTYGLGATITALVTSGGNPVDGGRLAISVDGTVKFSTTLDASGQASVTLPALSVGTHVVSALYTASIAYLSSSAVLAGGYVVDKAVPGFGLDVVPNGVVPAGRNVKLRALASRQPGAHPSALLPGGTVTFLEGTTVLCQSVPLAAVEAANAVAECDVPVPSAGTHALSLSYSGNSNYEPATTNDAFTVSVLTSTVTFTAAPPSSNFGQSVTWSVSVTASNGNTLAIPSGTVTFSSGTTTLCAAVPLAGGNASCAAVLSAAGTQAIVATYSSDGSFTGSSATAPHQVAKASVTTNVVSSGTPSLVGRTVLFEARVVSSAGVPSGRLDFIFDEGNTTLAGSTGVALDSTGTAVFSTAALLAGVHTVRAHAVGSTNFEASLESAEATFTQHILPASGGLTVMKVPAGSTRFGEEVLLQAFSEGDVSFSVDGAAPVVVRADSTGRASWASSTLAGGTHTIVVSDGATSVSVTHVVTRVASALVLSSSQQPQRFAAPVRLTATVAPASASGTVVFQSDGVALGAPVTVNSGVATFTTSALPVGVRALRAEYSGDGSLLASAATLAQTIAADPNAVTNLALSISPQPVTHGEATTLRVAVTNTAGAPVLGEVEAQVNGATIGPLTLNLDGRLSIPLSALPGGPHTVTVTYLGVAGATASASLTFVIDRAPTTVTLSTSTATAVSGQEVTLTAHLASSVMVQGGSVRFFEGSTVLGTAIVGALGEAEFTSAWPSPGSHTLHAEYSGATSFLPSTSASLSLAVTRAPTVTSVVVPSNPVMPGSPFELTATVVVPTPGDGAPTGLVTFTEGATVLGTAPVLNGIATLTAVTLPGGVHELTASYAGDALFLASTSAVFELDLRISATLTLVAVPNPALYLEPVIFTATLTAPAGGTVTFAQGPTTLGASALDAGIAALSWVANLAPGPQTIDATWAGDLAFSAAQGSVVLSIQERPTSLELTQSASTSIEGEAVTLTATVALGVTPPIPPALTVTFFDGAAELASSVFATDGTARFTTSTLTKGNHALTARFDGVTGFAPSLSGLLTHEVNEARVDAGVEEVDAGVEEVDAGIPTTPGVPSGCNCGSGGDPLALLLLALGLGLRRRLPRRHGE